MNNTGLKLSDRNQIMEASGPKISARDLTVGKHYLYQKFYKYRRVISMDTDDVYYDDKMGGGSCSKASFAAACPYEATPEEIAFIDENWNLRT